MFNSHTLLGRKEAAEYIGVSATVLDRLTRKGCIAYIEAPSSGKVGRPSRKWTVGDLNEFIDSCRRRATPVQNEAAPPRRKKKVALERLSAADILAMDKAGDQ